MQRRETRIAIGAAGIALVWAVGCGGDGSPGSSTPPEELNQKPVIEQLRVEPAEPIAGDVVRAIVTARDPDGGPVDVTYEWRVGGVPRSETGPTLEVPQVQKGTPIEVIATAADVLDTSEPARFAIRVRNRRPTLTQARIEPWEMVDRGESLHVRADGTDPDGDLLEYRYEWRVNDAPIEAEGPELSTAAMSPGDVIHARVVASDGESESDPIDTARVRVVGASPKIVSAPSGFSKDGIFRYTIEVEHPNGPAGLRFRLRKGPAGMWVDPVSGEVTWRPGPSQRGVHPVELEVKDSRGSMTVQAFSVTVGKAAEASSPPAQRAAE